jgi:Fe-S oxidoreductase
MDEKQIDQLKKLFETKLNSAMRMYLDTCVRCGICVDACHVYHSMPEIRYTAVGRAEVIRKIFKKYFKLQGKIAPWLGEVITLDDESIQQVYDAAYSCTGCRRCMVYCPFGIDTQQIMLIAKLLLIGADKEPKILSMLADMSITKGKDIENTRDDYAKAVKNLEPEVRALWDNGESPVIPMEKNGADLLYVSLSGAHTIISAAAVLNAAGENWTLSSFEAVNFGAFLGDPARMKEIAGRIISEAERLGVKEVAIVECGTAFRVLKYQTGRHKFKVVSIVELIARYIRSGRIKLDNTRFKGVLTYHDPCQIARNGGVMEEPRYVISHIARNFIELNPNRDMNWCCGGGGGLVAMGEKEFRMKSSKVKAMQVKASCATSICTACENCQSQLTDLNEYYQLGMTVESLTNLAAKALIKG